MWLTNSISSAHRLHLSVWFSHGSAQSLSCCVITCLEVTSGISSGTQLWILLQTKVRSTSMSEKKGPAPIPFAHPSLVSSWYSTQLTWLGPAEKCKFNCQRIFSLPWAPSKERTIFIHFFQGIHCVVQGSNATLVPEEPWCLCAVKPWAVAWLRDTNCL